MHYWMQYWPRPGGIGAFGVQLFVSPRLLPTSDGVSQQSEVLSCVILGKGEHYVED
jgi:hypothetical protein